MARRSLRCGSPASSRTRPDDVELHLVAGKHPRRPGRRVPTERIGGDAAARPAGAVRGVDTDSTGRRSSRSPVRSTSPTPPVSSRAATAAPLVVTVHDLAFVHDPAKFSRQGVRTMNRSLDADHPTRRSGHRLERGDPSGLRGRRHRRRPAPSRSARRRRRRGVRRRGRAGPASLPASRRVRAVRRHVRAPQEPARALLDAMRRPGMPGPLVVAGAEGWGDVGIADPGDTRFLGFIPDADLAPLYAACHRVRLSQRT